MFLIPSVALYMPVKCSIQVALENFRMLTGIYFCSDRFSVAQHRQTSVMGGFNKQTNKKETFKACLPNRPYGNYGPETRNTRSS
jgi:hypothetical protein